MRLLARLCLFLALLWAGAAQAAWALVQSNFLSNAQTTVTGQTFSVTLTNPVTSGNLVVGSFLVDDSCTITSIKDNKTNTYTQKSPQDDATNLIRSTLFELGNITNGPQTVSITISGAPCNGAMTLAEFSGGAASSDPSDGTTGQFQASVAAGANNQTSTAIITTTNGDLIVGNGVDDLTATAPSAGTSPNAFTSITTAVNTTNISGMRLEYFVQSSSGSIAATFGIATANDPAMTIVVALKPSGGGGGPSCPQTLALMGVGC